MRHRTEPGFLTSLNNDNNVLGTTKVRPIYHTVPSEYRESGSPYTFEDSVPRLLLRRYYKTGSPEHKILDHVLCTFSETERAVGTGLVDVSLDTDILVIHGSSIYGFDRSLVGEVLKSGRSDFVVMKSILLRLRVGHREMHLCKERRDKKNEFRWQLFIDTHVDLVGYMLEYCMFEDEHLRDVLYNRTSPLHCVMDQYEPHDTRFTYCGELPDLTGCIDMGNLWYNIRPKGETIISALIHIFVCKPQLQKCQVRNFMRILLRYFKLFPVMEKMIRMIIRVSLLGNYPHATFRPPFHRRIEIEKSYDPGRMEESQFYMWLIENEQFVYYTTKEFYGYTVDQHYAIGKTLEKTSYWKDVRTIVYEAMDVARSLFSHTLVDENRFATTEEELKKIHDDSLKFLLKLRKCGFGFIMVTEINKINEKKMNSVHAGKGDILEDLVSREVIECMELCARAVSRNLDNKIETKWLVCFGISEQGYELFRNLYYEYERLDSADNSIGRKLNKIFDTNPIDFQIIRHYLMMIQENRAMREYWLTADYYRNVVTALRSKYQLFPWQVLSDDADVFYYCPTCKNWANPVVDDDPKSSMNVYARGFVRALYDHVDEQLYCGKPPSSNATRKVSMESQPRINIHGDAVVKRVVQRKKETKSCKDTRLVPIHMLGKLKRLDGKLWTLCEVCASLIEFDPVKMNTQGVTCEYHRRDYMKLETGQIGTLNSNQDDLEREREKLGISDVKMAERCCYCGVDRITITSAQGGVPPMTVKILDDTVPNKISVEKVLICNEDFMNGFELFTTQDVVRKSEAMRQINAHRLRKMIGSKYVHR